MDIVVAPDPHEAAGEAAAWIARQLRNAVSRRGTATIAVSGGSTPALMLARLAELPVPWSATTIFQVDERLAPDGDPDRNATLLDILRSHRASIRLMPVTAADLKAASRRYAAQLPDRLDIVHFLEATSRALEGPYEIALVEGSVSTPDDERRIREIRAAGLDRD